VDSLSLYAQIQFLRAETQGGAKVP